MRLSRREVMIAAVLCLATFGVRAAQAEAPGFTIDKTDKGIAIKVGGQPFAEYVVNDPGTNKTYLWPVYGPTGKPMTRAFPMQDVPGEVKDHYHHRGICFGHESIGGFDTWAETGTWGKSDSDATKARIAKLARQKHLKFVELAATAEKAVVISEIDYVTPDGKPTVHEVRTMIFRVDHGQRLIDFNSEFSTAEGEVVFDDKKDAGLSIRVPTSVSVDSKKGGKIINSEGLVDAAAWGQKAKWCDYFGPVGEEVLGVAMLNHPSSFRHPTTWHVRTYGLFTANPFGTLDKAHPNGPHTLKAGEKLSLRHRYVLHQGETSAAKIEEAYQRYIGEK